MFSLCIFFCMVLNVPLVLVYNISGQAVEKYYVAGTTFICLICNVPPYTSGNLGHVLNPTKAFIRALRALHHPDAETETQFYGRSGCLSTIVDIPPPEISFGDSEALDNDYAQQECLRGNEISTAPGSDLEVGKKWWYYFGHGTSGATTSLSMCRSAVMLPGVDVVYLST
ncbi:hypothetical protein DFH08DRAFT_1041760 [Mycena albidolilacea]|uniref:Uncharacterized protein n=1 Tax=Mycena albidolilacea TaxID=1033008 RepID=A0AAD6ZAZ0_9AGAR|nr:hypothetical protein DFH08DRAFT_1041760 [Mycena albidolilacea]